jgi:hypothetical protein
MRRGWVLLALLGCQSPKAPVDQAVPDATVDAQVQPDAAVLNQTLRLVPGEGLTADVVFARVSNQPGPRVLQIQVAYPRDRLQFVRATPLAAVEAAGKEVAAKAEHGRLRLVVLSTANAQSVDSGPLVRLTFARTSPGPAMVRLVAEDTRFAPDAAGAGLTVGPPWNIISAQR